MENQVNKELIRSAMNQIIKNPDDWDNEKWRYNKIDPKILKMLPASTIKTVSVQDGSGRFIYNRRGSTEMIHILFNALNAPDGIYDLDKLKGYDCSYKKSISEDRVIDKLIISYNYGKEKETQRLSLGEINTLIDNCSNDTNRPTLNGIHITDFYCESSDGVRLFRIEKLANTLTKEKIIVPIDAVKLAKKLTPRGEEIKFFSSNENVRIQTPLVNIFTKSVSGVFPNTDSIFEDEPDQIEFIINTKDRIRFMRTIKSEYTAMGKTLSAKNIIPFQFDSEGQNLICICNSDVQYTYSGFYLYKILQNLTGDIVFQRKSLREPAFLSSENSKAILMPMRR